MFPIVFGILQLICIPVILLVVLYRARKKGEMSNSFQWTFGRLTNPYKSQFYYYEVVMLIRKTIYVSLIDLTNGWVKLERGFVLVCFLSADLYLDAFVKPFRENRIIPVFEIRSM